MCSATWPCWPLLCRWTSEPGGRRTGHARCQSGARDDSGHFIIDRVKPALSERAALLKSYARCAVPSMCGSTGGFPTPAKDDLHTIAMGVNRETYVSAINGFGRLGRKVAGIAMKDPGVELTLTFASYDPENHSLHDGVRQLPRNVRLHNGGVRGRFHVDCVRPALSATHDLADIPFRGARCRRCVRHQWKTTRTSLSWVLTRSPTILPSMVFGRIGRQAARTAIKDPRWS